MCTGGDYGEGYCLANDYEQAQVACSKLSLASSQRRRCSAIRSPITANKIEFRATGACIYAIASNYASAAGSNPTLTVFDELWGYTSESSRRLWDEMVVPPTRKIAALLTVSYAGFEGNRRSSSSFTRRA